MGWDGDGGLQNRLGVFAGLVMLVRSLGFFWFSELVLGDIKSCLRYYCANGSLPKSCDRSDVLLCVLLL